MMTGFGFGYGWIVMLLFWVVVIGGIVWAVTRLSPTGDGQSTNARRILDERFARGEIDQDEYRRLRDELAR